MKTQNSLEKSAFFFNLPWVLRAPENCSAEELGSFSNAWFFLLIFLVSTVQKFPDDFLEQRGFWVQTDFLVVPQGDYHLYAGAMRSFGDHLQITDHFGMNRGCEG